ncbi:MAG: TadE/TadG family type IV pilus assembly protein, partial [Tabrizicola sp.]
MFEQAAKRSISARLLQKVKTYRSDESGSIAIFVMLIFVIMILIGGIAVDVMRSEMRRVTYQQTFDRAVLAAANITLPPSQTPNSVGQSWYNIAGLGDEFTVDYTTPTITGESTPSSRKAEIKGKVRSYNFFMNMMDIPYFDIPVKSGAQQGVSKIEVILVLDITGSMGESSGSTTKIAALRQAATNFVNILKFNRDGGGNYTVPKDPNNLISIGMVPYSSNVNIPVNLRGQFAVSHLSWWDGVANQGVPDTNCFEIPETTYGTMGRGCVETHLRQRLSGTIFSQR